MKYKIIRTARFKKNAKLMQKRGHDMTELNEVIMILAQDKKLPDKYKDHALIGNYQGYRECHIKPDWLLIYKIKNDSLCLVLYRTGSHSDLM